MLVVYAVFWGIRVVLIVENGGFELVSRNVCYPWKRSCWVSGCDSYCVSAPYMCRDSRIGFVILRILADAYH